MNSILVLIKNYVLEVLNKDVIFSSLIFFLTILILNIFDVDIDCFDCEINGNYMDNSYLCVVDYFFKNIGILLNSLDPLDKTELDEIFILVIFYLVGEFIVKINKIFTSSYSLRKYSYELYILHPFLLAIVLATLISLYFLHYKTLPIIIIITYLLIHVYVKLFLDRSKIELIKANKKLLAENKELIENNINKSSKIDNENE